MNLEYIGSDRKGRHMQLAYIRCDIIARGCRAVEWMSPAVIDRLIAIHGHSNTQFPLDNVLPSSPLSLSNA